MCVDSPAVFFLLIIKQAVNCMNKKTMDINARKGFYIGRVIQLNFWQF